MFRRRFRLPSPALVISVVALSLVLGGTAFAASTSRPLNKKAVTELIKKLAPSLSVKHAKTASTAITQRTRRAPTARRTPPRHERHQRHDATNATTAATASVSNAIGSVTYVKGNVVSAPANGGSGYAESSASNAHCPTGTVVIGTGANMGSEGVEDSEITVNGTGPTNVEGFFDNFNNLAVGNNFVIAICSTVHTVVNPAGFLTKPSTR